MRVLTTLIIGTIGVPCFGDTVVPTRTIRAQEVIYAEDLRLHPAEIGGAFSAISDVAGKEARVALYPNRPVRPGDVGPPAIVERNQIVELIYDTRGLRIEAAGRALDRAGIGDLIKVMNIASRTTVIGKVDKDGSVSVSAAEFAE